MAKTKVFRKKSSKNWTKKRKMSINCKKPKGFSQKQYCKYGRKKNRKSHKKGGMFFGWQGLTAQEKEDRRNYINRAYDEKYGDNINRDGMYTTRYGQCMRVPGNDAKYCNKLLPHSSTRTTKPRPAKPNTTSIQGTYM